MEEMNQREDVLFATLSSITVIAAIMTISSGATPKKSSAVTPIYSHNFLASVFWLILAFIGSSGLFIVLGMEFLGLIFLIVYVGAICIIFLFVIMMIPGGSFLGAPTLERRSAPDLWSTEAPLISRAKIFIKGAKGFWPPKFNKKSLTKEKTRAGRRIHAAPTNTAIGVLIGAILGAELSSAVPESFLNGPSGRGGAERLAPPLLPLGVESILTPQISSNAFEIQNLSYMRVESAASPFLVDCGPNYNDSFFAPSAPGCSNLEAIGAVLYINYYYAFILVSFILLVAMIGAIVLGLQSSDRN
uniref:NADH-ubiquinone oxidoreductase chain 6 n=1 Tax=Placozoan sp. BZ2423 TaxID=401705 RepID=A2T440_9METZ|nr:NADH dehydrogenase subunit 6 [Placozoan sp. BZ2423]